MPSASVLGCEGVGRGRSQGSGRSVSVQGRVVGGRVAAGRACTLARSATRLRPLEPLERKVSDAGLQTDPRPRDSGGGISCSFKM